MMKKDTSIIAFLKVTFSFSDTKVLFDNLSLKLNAGNSMMGVGVVFIPGMMTWQILAGADPLQAIRYQIIVMVMLVGSTAIGSLVVVYLVRKLCFGPGERLLLQPRN